MSTIFIVEDERSIALMLHSVLEDEGYRVHTAANGRLALELVASLRPDLLITDFMLPGLDGAELCRAVRRDGRFEAMPIILMSAASQAASLAAEVGATFLAKPFELDALLALIEELLPPG